MNRISIKDIENAVDRLNRMAGTPMKPWARVDGKNTANIGNYHTSQAYGGVAIHQMQSAGGGIRQVFGCGHVPKRECFEQLHSFINGFDTASRA